MSPGFRFVLAACSVATWVVLVASLWNAMTAREAAIAILSFCSLAFGATVVTFWRWR